MANGSDTQVQSIGRAMLTPLVRQALGSQTVEVTNWDIEQIHGGAGHGSAGGSAIYRVLGQASDQGQAVEWSLVVKVLYPPENRGKVSDWDYWRREACAYGSGLLDDLPGGLAAPRCFGIAQQSEQEYWLWLEEVSDEIGPRWPLEHYGVVSHHLGQFNGAYVIGQTIPSQQWLCRNWLRSQLARPGAVAEIPTLRESLTHPLVRTVYTPDIAGSILRFWADRELFLSALKRLPRAFCHRDAFRCNLFARRSADGRIETVAIDWAFVGAGAIREEIVPLVSASLSFREVEWTHAQELDAIVFDGYLRGLREAGWNGDATLVRFAHAASSVLTYAVARARGLLSVVLDESQRTRWAPILGCSPGELVDHLRQWLRFLAALGDEAWELLDELGPYLGGSARDFQSLAEDEKCPQALGGPR